MDHEFEAIVRAAFVRDSDLANWRFDGLNVGGLAPGRWPVEQGMWATHRELTIDLARRTVWLRAGGADLASTLRERRIGNEVGAGWYSLLIAFDTQCHDHGHTVARHSQITEKFGPLPVYQRGDDTRTTRKFSRPAEPLWTQGYRGADLCAEARLV